MNQSDFINRHAWLYGLQEYFTGTAYAADFDLLFKALMHDNGYRKRDLLIRLSHMDNSAIEFDEQKMCSFYNCIMHKDLPDYDVTQSKLIGLVKHFVKDDYTPAAYRFIRSFDEDLVPDFNDFYSRGQIASKKWLVEELSKVVDQNVLGNVAVFGAWYNFIAHMLFEKFNIDKMYSIDIDGDVIHHIKKMMRNQINSGQLVPITLDASTIKWFNNDIVVNTDAGATHCNDIDLVINTSCEHMSDDWFNNLPTGTIVLLQTNNYFDNIQHSNCVKTLNDALDKYKMSNILYKGTLKTELYDRFMIIGVK